MFDVHLVGEFTGEADPRDAHGNPVEAGVAPRHEPERVVRHVEVAEHRADHIARARADHRERRPVIGHRCRAAPAGAATRSAATPPSSRGSSPLRRWWCRREPVLGQPQHGAVVDHHAVDAAHHAVPDRARPSGCSSGWCRCGRAARPRRGPVRRSCRVSSRRGCRHRCASRDALAHTAASMSSAGPRPGSDADASTARRPRTPRPARRASRAARSCARGRTARHGHALPARRTRPGCTAAGTSWCPTLSMPTPRSSAVMPEAITPDVLPWSCAVPIVV